MLLSGLKVELSVLFVKSVSWLCFTPLFEATGSASFNPWEPVRFWDGAKAGDLEF